MLRVDNKTRDQRITHWCRAVASLHTYDWLRAVPLCNTYCEGIRRTVCFWLHPLWRYVQDYPQCQMFLLLRGLQIFVLWQKVKSYLFQKCMGTERRHVHTDCGQSTIVLSLCLLEIWWTSVAQWRPFDLYSHMHSTIWFFQLKIIILWIISTLTIGEAERYDK